MTAFRRLCLLIVACLLLAAGGSGALVYAGFSREAREVRQDTLLQAQLQLWQQTLARHSEVLRASAGEILATPGFDSALRASDRDAMKRLLEPLQERLQAEAGVGSIAVFNQFGLPIYPHAPGTPTSTPAIGPSDASADAARGSARIGFRQNSNREYQLVGLFPVRLEDASVGQLLVSVPAARIVESFAEFRGAAPLPAALLDLRGQVIAASAPEGLLADLLPWRSGAPDVQRVLETDSRLDLVATPVLALTGEAIAQLLSGHDAAALQSRQDRMLLLAFGGAGLLAVLLFAAFFAGLRAEWQPLTQLIGGFERLAQGDTSVEPPRGSGSAETLRLSATLDKLRRDMLVLVTLEISRERQRSRQIRFIRSQMTKLAGTLDSNAKAQVLEDLAHLEAEAEQQGDPWPATKGAASRERSGLLAVIDRDQGDQDDFALLASAFQNMAIRIQDQYERLGGLVEELNSALETQSNFEMLQRELNIAHDIQMSLLPVSFPDRAGISVRGLMLPAKEVGGDFYDFFELPDARIAVVVADVSGKGIPAAFFSLVARTLVKAITRSGLSPAACLTEVNEILAAENDQMMFVTLFLGIFDPRTGRLVYGNAGHNPPLILSAGSEVRSIPSTGNPALAVMPGIDYQEQATELTPGEVLFLFTDGVTEAFDPAGEAFGDARLETLLANNRAMPTWMLPQAVSNAVKDFEAGGEQSDDITCVALGYRRDAAPDSA